MIKKIKYMWEHNRPWTIRWLVYSISLYVLLMATIVGMVWMINDTVNEENLCTSRACPNNLSPILVNGKCICVIIPTDKPEGDKP